ncbi:MAG: hypothetical protein ACRDKL_02885 [Solirubrobacteraceae bacterium]
MGEVPAKSSEGGYEAFVERWLASLLAVFLRAVREPALTYDLATETLAGARLGWEDAPAGADAVAWVLRLGTEVLAAAAERGGVPATERLRGGNPAPHRLTVAEQQEIMALAEHHVELPAAAGEAADVLARTCPPPHVLARLRTSELVEAEPLPDGPAHHHHQEEEEEEVHDG